MHRLILLDAVRRNGNNLIHLTGPLQVVARATMGEPLPGAPIRSSGPVQVDLHFDAARVRGVGLKTRARYWTEGVHQSRHQPEEFAPPMDVGARFELLGYAPDGPPITCLTLAVRFRVTVPADGRVTVEASDVELLPPVDDTSNPVIRTREEPLE